MFSQKMSRIRKANIQFILDCQNHNIFRSLENMTGEHYP